MEKIQIVCFANFCRSPVAEKVLKNLNNKYEFLSSGIKPMPSASMDSRSIEFLKNKGVDDIIHLPTEINEKKVEDSVLILALDLKILNILNRKFRNHRSKIKLFSYGEINIDTSDPFKHDDQNFTEIMENIYLLCESFQKRFQKFL